ncbi:MAG: caspase family protein, partial [Chloroflexi bacterium]|nr:caspase family protein [Chloroflexota bacterium]
MTNKRALLIGINDYPNMPKLNGAVNDARLMAGLLKSSFGFMPGNMTLLLDEQATRQSLLAAFERLLRRVKDDDAVVFFYSGWGHRLPDPTGRWPNGMVSTLMPYDVGADGGGQVTYDELCERLLQLKAAKPYLTLIIDTNYAGTIGPCLDADPHLRERTVFLGACRTDEFAYESRFGDVSHGMFSYTLSQALVSAGPKATYRQVFEQVSQVLARSRQHPQMEGEGDRRLFGAGKVESMRFVPVIGRTRTTATLSAGAALGMTAGSTWAIYAPGTLKVTADTPKRGLVEITKVDAVTSEARILSEAGAEAIAPGTKAVEETHSYGEMRLVVDFRSPDEELLRRGEGLRRLLEDSQLVRIAGPDEHADVTAWLLAPRSAVQKSDPVPQLGALAEPTWALVAEKDRLLRPTYRAEERSAVWDLRDKLEQLARQRNILNLRNPNLNSQLVGKVDFILERPLADGTWAEAQPEAQSGMVVFEDGDQVRLVISNHHQAPLYISILDLPWQGTIDLIFPSGDKSEQMGPGERVELEPTQVYIPEERFKRTGADAEPPETRVETVKLFATAYPIDFRALVRQEAVRGMESSIGETTLLWELLDMARTGHGSRRSRPVQLPAEQEWITVERSFALLRKG